MPYNLGVWIEMNTCFKTNIDLPSSQCEMRRADHIKLQKKCCPSEPETSTPCWFNDWPPSSTLANQKANNIMDSLVLCCANVSYLLLNTINQAWVSTQKFLRFHHTAIFIIQSLLTKTFYKDDFFRDFFTVNSDLIPGGTGWIQSSIPCLHPTPFRPSDSRFPAQTPSSECQIGLAFGFFCRVIFRKNTLARFSISDFQPIWDSGLAGRLLWWPATHSGRKNIPLDYTPSLKGNFLRRILLQDSENPDGNTEHRPNVGLMLHRCQRRRINIKPISDRCLVFAL